MSRFRVTAALLLLAAALLVAGCVAGESESEGVSPEHDLAAELYQYRDTYVGDNSAVSAIVSALPFMGMAVDSIALQTDATPYRVTVNYMVANTRADHRGLQAEDRAMRQTAAVMLALIDNADEVVLTLADQYGEFHWGVWDRQGLHERYGMEAFTAEAVAAATESDEDWRAYLTAVMFLPVAPEADDGRSAAMNAALSDDEEIVMNSGIGFEVEFTPDTAIEGVDLDAWAARHDIDRSQYHGQTVYVLMMEINDFKTNISGPRLFVFADDELVTWADLSEEEERKVQDIMAAMQ